MSAGLAILGVLFGCFVLGAAVMYYELPTSGFLSKAFLGARAWQERHAAMAATIDPNISPKNIGNVDRPDETYDGYTLCTFASMSASSTQAFLLNMEGEVVHRWSVAFSQVWPNPPHIRTHVEDSLVCIFACYLYPNGDLLVVFHGLEDAVKGFGLAKLDKDSKVLWSYSANAHHDVDVDEDGNIYAIRHDVVSESVPGLEGLPTPRLVDSLVLLSPDGKERRPPIPMLEAFRDSPYASLLAPLDQSDAQTGPALLATNMLHMNCVRVLPRALASKFPEFKPGEVLFSLREIDTIGVIDPTSGAVVWAARGPWARQHDPQFLSNGNLLIFDNLGWHRGSRVLEYNPRTQAIPWSYSGEGHGRFFSKERGMSQRLPNGNTLIVDSQGKEVFEVTSDKRLVWSRTFKAFVTSARRYSAREVPFVKGEPRGR